MQVKDGERSLGLQLFYTPNSKTEGGVWKLSTLWHHCPLGLSILLFFPVHPHIPTIPERQLTVPLSSNLGVQKNSLFSSPWDVISWFLSLRGLFYRGLFLVDEELWFDSILNWKVQTYFCIPFVGISSFCISYTTPINLPINLYRRNLQASFRLVQPCLSKPTRAQY